MTLGAIVAGATVLWVLHEPPVDPTAPVAAPTGATAVATPQRGPTSGQAQAPAASRAEQWESIATVLGELERHLNRAKLQFADIPDLSVAAAHPRAMRVIPAQANNPDPNGAPGGGQPAIDGAPGGGQPAIDGAPGGGAQAVAPPPSPPTIDPAERERAQKMWRDWSTNWSSDLDYALREFMPRDQVDPSLLGIWGDVSQLAGAMRTVPPGNPPSAAQRQAWLDRLFETARTARVQVDAAR